MIDMQQGHSVNHEPNLREMVSDLDGLRELMNERDRRYTELRKDDQKAVEAALVAVEKATVEFKDNQKDYNQQHNGLLQKMDDQHKETLPRPEANTLFSGLQTKDEELRRDMMTIREELRREAQRQNDELRRDIQGLRESRVATDLATSPIKDLALEIRGLRDSRSVGVGRTQGATAIWGYIVGAAGLAVAIATIIRFG